MNKHTPGPWKVVRNRATEDTHHHEVLARDTEYHREVVVCECFPINDDGQTDSESAANAALIAAAPDLLQAIEALLATAQAVDAGNKVKKDFDGCGFSQDIFDLAAAAISKAKPR